MDVPEGDYVVELGKAAVRREGSDFTITAYGAMVQVAMEACAKATERGWEGEVPDAPHEIDLRGLTGEEGWEQLDKLIDRAIPAGLETVNVIHGFGTGRLRDHVHARLKSDARVASFKEAGPGRGGGGATQVFLQG